ESGATTTRKGYEKPHHPVTHEELPDKVLGYQVLNSWFVRRAMARWAYFVNALASVKEGDGTLLDRSLVFAHSDQELAQQHAIDGIPMMTAGSAAGRMKTGLHIDGNGDPTSRLSYTVMRVMGVPITEWGVGSMKTSQEIGDILV